MFLANLFFIQMRSIVQQFSRRTTILFLTLAVFLTVNLCTISMIV